ncbi:MAG TPA: hypothetical protein VLH60_08160 [Sedimentisphaerales bacterium]|nr:hypothetical protein [Sedimentisphaerales bacterium]
MRHPAAAYCMFTIAFLAGTCANCYAVTSTLTKHDTAEDFQKGQTDGTVISSEGSIRLGPATSLMLAAEQDEVWVFNTIIASPDGTLYAGTSPMGKILKYAAGEWTTLYSMAKAAEPNNADADPNSPADPNAVSEPVEPFGGEHVYALAIGPDRRLTAAISGENCRIIRFENDKPVTIFEPNQAMYVFAMVYDDHGNLFLATGPEGKLYKLAPDGTYQVLYTATEKNITCLVLGTSGFLYAGSDEKGRIYRINAQTGSASVLYDAEEAEVAALVFGSDGMLYAAVSSEQTIRTTGAMPAGVGAAQPGRTPAQGSRAQDASREIRIAHMPAREQAPSEKPPSRPAPAQAAKPSAIYRITREGFVTKVFEHPVAFFDMAYAGNRLIVATGHNGQLFAIDLETNEQSELHTVKEASQITAICPVGDDLVVGTANTARVIRILNRYAGKATFDSSLIDAGQPAMWGRLHIDAQIPDGTSISVSARSGNVSDVNDPTYSPWTEPVRVDGPVTLVCPVARFCQYRLILTSDGRETPVVRQVVVSSVVGNMAPIVESISIAPPAAAPARDKEDLVRVNIKARDANRDTLTYKIEMRRLGRQRWITISEDLDKNVYEWNTRTVEDGRYELRVTASDRRSNTEATALKGARISEPVVVDNTPPQITQAAVNVDSAAGTMTLRFKAVDELSVILKAEYAINSASQWNGTLPDDLIFDDPGELFTVLAKDLDAGEHVIAVMVTDAAGNTGYKTWDFTVGEGR